MFVFIGEGGGHLNPPGHTDEEVLSALGPGAHLTPRGSFEETQDTYCLRVGGRFGFSAEPGKAINGLGL